MNRFVIFLLLLTVCFAQPHEEQGLPFGVPVTRFSVSGRDYLFESDPEKKNPKWVLEYLTINNLAKRANRAGIPFRIDPKVPVWAQTHAQDYTGTGYDRGHMSPADDNTQCKEAMEACLYMTNMAPQAPDVNRIVWLHFEEHVRRKLLSGDYLKCWVLSVPIYSSKSETLCDETWIPSMFGKSVLGVTKDGKFETTCWIVPNKQGLDQHKDYSVSEAEFERKAKMV